MLGLQDPVPVIVPLPTVPLPVNSTKPDLLPATNSRFNLEDGTGFEGTPIRTPCTVLLTLLGSPVPEIEPCPLLLLAIKQAGPSTENVPTGVVTLQGLETKSHLTNASVRLSNHFSGGRELVLLQLRCELSGRNGQAP